MTTEAPVNGGGTAAPQAAEQDANGNLGAPKTTSFVAVLEAANDLRKMDHVLDVAADANGGTSAPAPTLEDLADALDGDEPDAYVSEEESDDGDSEDSDDGRAAYSAQTVAAISSLMHGEESALFSPQVGEEEEEEAKPALSRREITLQERTTAMLSVYKDYIQEMEERVEGEEGANMGDDDKARELRKEEIKVAALENFCRGVDTDEYVSDEDVDVDDEDDDEYEGIEYRRHRPIAKPHMQPPTAATTTAAFRLKAEVALKAVGDKTAQIADKVKTTVNDAVSRTSDIQEDAGEFDNDYDFADYHKKVSDGHREDLEYGIPRQQQLENGGDQSDAGSAVYGMHILDRDSTLQQKRKSEENEDTIGYFNELCDELGVTPDTHEGLRHFYHRPRSTRYRYPQFRSKKFKQSMMYCGALALFLAVGASIISAVTNGFEEVRQKDAPPLPDWKSEMEWQERQKEEWEKTHPDASHPAHHGTMVGIDGQPNEGKLFQKISAAYRPVWYDRSAGWTGQTYAEAIAWCDAHDGYIPCPYEVYCPTGTSLLAGVMEEDGESWAPVVNDRNEWVQVGRSGGVCDLYSSRYGKRPTWGETGQDNEAATRHVMCCRAHPINANGKDMGAQEQNGKSHVFKPKGPPKGAPKAPPIPPSDEFEQIPPPAEEAEEETLSEEQIPPHQYLGGPPTNSEEEMSMDKLFLSVSKAYNPVWYDRETGWKGRTYQDSLEFCAKFDGYIPCPYEVYCPGGRGKLLDGVRDEGESWSAVIDSPNDWVQVGVGGVCNLYSETAKELPSWGMTGENNEEITRHIMCCDGSGHADPLADGAAAASSASSMTYKGDYSGPPLVVLPGPSDPSYSLTELETKVTETHHPLWFSSFLGWEGTTHADARTFCESQPSKEGSGTLHLCPLAAYCPNGPIDIRPLYLQMDAFEGVQWAPIDNQDNAWVMVGKFNDETPLTCQSYMQINHHEPEWGLDGTSPELKDHILCCEDTSGTNEDSANGGSSQEGALTNMVVGIQPESGPGKYMGGDTSESSEAVGPGDHGSNSIEADTDNAAAVSTNEGNAAVGPGDHDTTTATDSEPGNDAGSSMTAWEIQVEELHHPTWYSNLYGWQGGTHDDAKAFCESIPHGDDGTLHLCPVSAYCPNGPQDTGPLWLQMDAYEGVQWAPISNEENGWIMIGDIAGLTCQTYMQINNREPTWGLDGSSTQMKEHILCCEDNTDAVAKVDSQPIESAISSNGNNDSAGVSSVTSASDVEGDTFKDSVESTFNPMWFDYGRGGWEGGSHDDAVQFCEQFAGSHGKRMELCPFAAYCPKGPSKPVMEGHLANFDEEGEQWAPVYGEENHWVLISMEGNNPTTTCLSHVQIHGEEPSWGLDGSNKDMKKHVMCCSPFQ